MSSLYENLYRWRESSLLALQTESIKITYSQLWYSSLNLSHTIPDDCQIVLYFCEQPYRLPIATLACWHRSVPIFPVSSKTPKAEIDRIIATIGKDVFFLKNDWPIDTSKSKRIQGPRSKDHPAFILCTSGSTAEPKIFEFSLSNLTNASVSECRESPIDTANARILNLRPPYTSGGTNTIWPAWQRGDCLCFTERPNLPNAEVWNNLQEKFLPTITVVSLAFARGLILSAMNRKLHSGKGRTLYYGGGNLRGNELKQLRKTGFNIYMRYGMTECAHIISKVKHKTNVPPAHVGKPYQNTIVAPGKNRKWKFKSDGFADYQYVHGQKVQVKTNGWYQSDDTGKIDRYLWLKGRDSRQVVVSGHRVSCIEVENELLTCGKLSDIVVLGILDPWLGERLCCLVKTKRDGISDSELRSHASNKLCSYKIPTDIRFADEIPTTASGKRDWRKIRALWPARSPNWNEHFALLKIIRDRKNKWAHINRLYTELLITKVPEAKLKQASDILKQIRKTKKHTHYFCLWLANALAYQYFKFYKKPQTAEKYLLLAFKEYQKATPWPDGNHARCRNSFWLILLLNISRLRVRQKKFGEAMTLLLELEKIAYGKKPKFSVFGASIERIARQRKLVFTPDKNLKDFILSKIELEQHYCKPAISRLARYPQSSQRTTS